jgi:hypothetical protein
MFIVLKYKVWGEEISELDQDQTDISHHDMAGTEQ